jgi:23S rRNA pseudouridine2605 synthase
MDNDTPTSSKERVTKVIARAGVCSRREAEKLVSAGRVIVNNNIVDTMGVKVSSSDEIRSDGEKIPTKEPTKLWRYHKPIGLITTHKDELQRPSVFNSLPKYLPRVISIGRLDLNSEGLLLLTNDGELARSMEHPSRGWVRRYRARVHGTINEWSFEHLSKGITIDQIHYGPIIVKLDRKTTSNSWLNVSLKEGKKREVRIVLNSLGLSVNRLIRTAYGPFQLGSMKTGEVKDVPKKVLIEQLGKDLGK